MYGINDPTNAISKLTNSWDFAFWNPFNEKIGEHIGKKLMLQTSWKARKTLNPNNVGFKIGMKYWESQVKKLKGESNVR